MCTPLPTAITDTLDRGSAKSADRADGTTTAANVRQVQVSVSAEGQLVCNPAVLDVSGADVLISFELATRGWRFPDSQAVVVTDGGTQFPLPAWTVHPHQAALLDLDTAAGDFSYTVQVLSTTGGQRLRLDPTIRNRP